MRSRSAFAAVNFDTHPGASTDFSSAPILRRTSRAASRSVGVSCASNTAAIHHTGNLIMIRYVIMNTMRKLCALAILAAIPVLAASSDRKADQRARESYRKELRNQRHAAALAQSREHRDQARERNKERRAYAREMRRGHRK